MTKEEIMMKHCSDNGLLSMRLGKSILAAMEERDWRLILLYNFKK